MNLTTVQKIALAVAILSFLAAGGSATDLVAVFGSPAAKMIASVSSLGAGIGGIIVAFLTGQGATVRMVQDMPGVEKIVVNRQANATLAQLAVDAAQPKIEAVPSDEAQVTRTAATA